MDSAPSRFGPLPIAERMQRNMGHLAVLALVLLLGLFLALAPISWGVSAVAGAFGTTLLLVHPTLGVLGLAAAIPYGALYTVNVGVITVSGAQIVLLAFLAAWALQSLAFRRISSTRTPLTLPLLLFVAFMALSLLRAQNLTLALKEMAKWIGFAGVFLYVRQQTNWEDRRWLIIVLLLAGTTQGLLGIYQFARGIGPRGFVLFGRYMRAHGTFGQPNPYGGYLGLLLPLGYATMLTQWRVLVPQTPQAGLLRRVIWALSVVATIVITAALVMSWSRGALLGLAAGGALVLLALARRAWGWLLVFAVFLALTLPAWQPYLPAAYLGRLDDMTEYLGQDLSLVEIDDDNFAVIERLAHWDAAWQMFAQDPWLGVGIGQYAVVYPSVALPRWEDPLGHAHNTYLNVLAETGLVGLSGYLLFVGSALVMSWQGIRTGSGWPRTLALASVGMMGHLLAHGLVDNLYVQEIYLLIAMILGMLQLPCGAGAHAEATDEQGMLSPGAPSNHTLLRRSCA